MPFFRSQEVKDQFYLTFLNEAVQTPLFGMPQYFIAAMGVGFPNILLRFFNRGGASQVEQFHEYYPCIVIQDFVPELDRQRLVPKDWVEGAVNYADSEVQKVYLPIPFNFRFQVSAVVDNTTHMASIFDWFVRKFEAIDGQGFFLFNKVDSPDFGLLGDVVPYTVNYTSLERNDGRHEYVFDFTLKTNLDLKPAEWHTMVEEINLGLHQKGDSFIETKILT